MMIAFEKIEIQDFKSIKSAELVYKKGIWHVMGENNDASFSSNGSGKTTLMQAIQQCLFNKTSDTPPIDDVGRKLVSGEHKSYKLTLWFSIEGTEYKIINDRKSMTIQVFIDGEDIKAKTIVIALKKIQEILGMDFKTFITLTSISQDTMLNLLDNFSSSNLMKVILNFSEIADFEKAAKLELSAVNKDIAAGQKQLDLLETSLSILDQFTYIDVTPMTAEKTVLLKELDTITTTQDEYVAKLQQKISSVETKLTEEKQLLQSTKDKLESAVCKCCGTTLDLTETDINELIALKKNVGEKIKGLREILTSLNASLQETKESNSAQTKELQEKVQALGNNIALALSKNQLYEENKTQHTAIKIEQVQLETKQTALQNKAIVLQEALQIVKAGNLQESLLQSFNNALNFHITEFMKYTSLDYILVTANVSKAAVTFSIHDLRFSQDISIHMLSGGEKTRLRLIVLLAMLYTIKDLTQLSTNILVFDESLDTLDASAAEDLARLFDYLITNDDKFIALISHGKQLAKIEFNGVINVTKTNSISEVLMEEL